MIQVGERCNLHREDIMKHKTDFSLHLLLVHIIILVIIYVFFFHFYTDSDQHHHRDMLSGVQACLPIVSLTYLHDSTH